MSTPDEKNSVTKQESNQQDNLPEPTFRLNRPDNSQSESMESSSATQSTPKTEIQWITEPAEEVITPPVQRPSEVRPLDPPVVEDQVIHEEQPKSSTNGAKSSANAQNLEDEEEVSSAAEPPPQTEKDKNGFIFYKCRFCGLTFNFMTTLKAHERVHDIDTPYVCNKCGESFHFMCELEYHAKSHLKQKGYKCECGRTFYQYTDLLYHTHPGEEGHANPPPLPEPQPVRRSFSRPAIDPAEFPVPEFAEKGFEPRHPMRVYSEVRSKPYICQYCCKSYADSRQLAYHMASHRGERMFNPRASRYLMCRNENSYIPAGADFKPPYI
ncbi:hypothetical protein M3Y98_01133300 [Aphelenchoides besseyi]|nr:hypothetical protein M3Y98_01133300 [Aphelenchoides besseyi]KAI6210610.1 hypothetical protein M3Y96_00346300 [Aphelenchoides besseyi]